MIVKVCWNKQRAEVLKECKTLGVRDVEENGEKVGKEFVFDEGAATILATKQSVSAVYVMNDEGKTVETYRLS